MVKKDLRHLVNRSNKTYEVYRTVQQKFGLHDDLVKAIKIETEMLWPSFTITKPYQDCSPRKNRMTSKNRIRKEVER